MTALASLLTSLTLFTAASLQQAATAPLDTERKVSVGSYRLFLHCTGDVPGPTIVLLNGGGATTSTWSKVQPAVAPFARVCSYDREGSGQSELAMPPLQTVAEIVEDLHTLLRKAGLPEPYILVGHSIGGIYARRYTDTYPASVGGLVFVDSAHEEQVWRFERISHSLLFEYKSWPNQTKLQNEGFLPTGALLRFHADVPLVVLEHGITWPRGTLHGMTEAEYAQTKQTWDLMQHDLSSRSQFGQLRIAEKSGHFIQNDQPELVTQAIHDVLLASRQHAIPLVAQHP